MFDARSCASACSTWAPSPGTVNVGVPEQAENTSAESSLHSMTAPGSLEEIWKVAARRLSSGGGPASKKVSGGTVSSVQLRTDGEGSTLPARSTARTSKRCGPSGSGPMLTELAQPANGAPASASSRHSKVAPLSVPVKVK